MVLYLNRPTPIWWQIHLVLGFKSYGPHPQNVCMLVSTIWATSPLGCDVCLFQMQEKVEVK